MYSMILIIVDMSLIRLCSSGLMQTSAVFRYSSSAWSETRPVKVKYAPDAKAISQRTNRREVRAATDHRELDIRPVAGMDDVGGRLYQVSEAPPERQ